MTDRVLRRVQITCKTLTDLPRPLAYIWQGWWPAHARGDGSDETGTKQLHRRKRRIPEPFHTEALLWMDREKIDDLTLLMGVYVGRNGLVARTRKGGLPM